MYVKIFDYLYCLFYNLVVVCCVVCLAVGLVVWVWFTCVLVVGCFYIVFLRHACWV